MGVEHTIGNIDKVEISMQEISISDIDFDKETQE
jgi:hypothetical protein